MDKKHIKEILRITIVGKPIKKVIELYKELDFPMELSINISDGYISEKNYVNCLLYTSPSPRDRG